MGAHDDELDLPGEENGSDEEGGGGPTPLDWARFVLAAVGRRRLLVTLLVLAGAATLVVYYRSRTPMYRVEARILAQRLQALPSIVRPTGLDESPTRSAQDFIRRRESLVAMVSQAKLDFSRPPGGESGPDGLLARIQKALHLEVAGPENTDPMEAMVRRVEQALKVQIEEGSIVVQVDWPEPNQAFLLAQAALQNFLEGRHLQEVTTIDESVSMLEARVETLRAELRAAIAETSRNPPRPPPGEGTGPTRQVPGLPAQASEELVTLKSQLDAKERAIRDVDEFRRRRLMELQSQLDAQLGVYSEAHPIVIGLRHDLESLSQESPQIAILREDEKRLRKDYTERLAAEARLRGQPAPPPYVPRAAVTSSTDEPERVKDARLRYQRMVDRMGAAQLELDAARASFKYRYDVSWPARVPKDPFGPNPRKIFGLGGFLVILGSFLAAALLELRGGRVTQRWQVERGLKLRILGELGPR